MEEKPELYITDLKPWLHLLDEGHSATGYVIEGEDKVCVIDTSPLSLSIHMVTATTFSAMCISMRHT